MKHWEVAYLRPGFYSVAQGSNAGVQLVAVPLTLAAQHVAREFEPRAEMYPDADRGDLTPLSVVAIDSVEDLPALDDRANSVHEQLGNRAEELECELVPA